MKMYPPGNMVKLSPSDLNAAAHTSGDVIFTKHELKNAVPSKGGCSILKSVSMFVEGAAADDDLVLLFFDNSTALGEPTADPASDITADEFRTASCIGHLWFDGSHSVSVANGLLYQNHSDQYGLGDTFIKAANGETSIWVSCIQKAGTLDLTDTDSITCTFGFEYLG